MRTRVLPIVLWLLGLVILLELMIALAHAGQVPPAPSPLAVPPSVALTTSPPATLSDGERCNVDSLHQRITIVALRAELAKLQARVAELEAPLVEQAAQKERAALVEQFRARIKPPEGSTFDWGTLTFAPPTPAETPSTTKPPPTP